MTTPDTVTTAEAWNAVAQGYDELVTPINFALAERALRLVDLQPGTRLLDVACGAGAVAIPAARQGAEVLATDFAPEMIDRLKARAQKEGLSTLDARVMDGQNMDLEDDSFDIAASQFGVMLFPDLPRGLSEMARVTRPGGKVLVTAFGPPQEQEFISLTIAAIQKVAPEFPGLPMDPPPLPFQVADPEVLKQRLVEAGLHDVTIQPTNHHMEPQNGSHLWNGMAASNPIGSALISQLTEDQQTRAQGILDDMLRQRANGGPLVVNNPVNIAIGTK